MVKSYITVITLETINRGVKTAYLPARLEVVGGFNLDFLPNGSVVYVDGAHNKHGAVAIADFLKSQKDIDGLNNYLINGRTAGSDLQGFLESFVGVVDVVAGVRVRSEYNSEHPENIIKAALNLEMDGFTAVDIFDAIEKISKPNKRQVRIVICGSFYLARDLKILLKS